MKNPYKRNIYLQIVLILIWALVLAFTCRCNEFCCSEIHIPSIWENIILGLLSSSILLLLLEIFQKISDRRLYGYLEGTYERTIITDVIANSDLANGEKRTDNLKEETKRMFEAKGQHPISGSRYVELLYYKKIGKEWRIHLRYLHHGIYQGSAEYHKYWIDGDNSTIVEFTLTLNLSNITTGSGNYNYLEIEDYGHYEFQVNKNRDEILVEYRNSIPTGLSEGYEKWKRTSS